MLNYVELLKFIEKLPSELKNKILIYSHHSLDKYVIYELREKVAAKKALKMMRSLRNDWWNNGSLEYFWHDYIKLKLSCDEIHKLAYQMMACKCCKRHQDFYGSNKLIYVKKDYRCKCPCRHNSRYLFNIT